MTSIEQRMNINAHSKAVGYCILAIIFERLLIFHDLLMYSPLLSPAHDSRFFRRGSWAGFL